MKKLSPMFRNIFLLLFFIPLVLFTNCKNTSTEATSKQMENPTVEILEFTTLLSDSQSNFTASTQQVITSEETLNNIVAKINSTRTPGIPVPKVNFTQYEVFFYAPGEVSHGVEDLNVATVLKEKNVVTVTLAAGKPQGEFSTTVMSQPCIMIQYKKQGLPVKVLSASKTK